MAKVSGFASDIPRRLAHPKPRPSNPSTTPTSAAITSSSTSIAPIMPLGDWRTAYGRLLDEAAASLDGVRDLDLTVEAITHRFTDNSKEVLQSWYPRTRLEMDESRRTQKRTKFGGSKYVYPRELMSELRAWFTEAVSVRLPGAPLLYWT